MNNESTNMDINTDDILNKQEKADKKTDNTEQKSDTSHKNNSKESHKKKLSKEEILKEELISCKEKIAEINDKYLRLYSEFDNFRKRTIKEKSDIYKTAGEDVIINIISIVDDFERALKATENNPESKAHHEGIELIFNKFKKILEQKGVIEMVAIGENFDTDLHEALTKIVAPSEDLKGKIVDVVEKGYTMNGKVIRFAKVVVGE